MRQRNFENHHTNWRFLTWLEHRYLEPPINAYLSNTLYTFFIATYLFFIHTLSLFFHSCPVFKLNIPPYSPFHSLYSPLLCPYSTLPFSPLPSPYSTLLTLPLLLSLILTLPYFFFLHSSLFYLVSPFLFFTHSSPVSLFSLLFFFHSSEHYWRRPDRVKMLKMPNSKSSCKHPIKKKQ